MLFYTVMLLSMFPEYQEKLFEEVNSIFEKTGTFEITYADTQNMKYMDMVLNESMRIMSPVPLIGREVSQDITLSNGWEIPKGLTIMLSIYHTHRRKDIWGPHADSFYPDHFLPSHFDQIHPYAYLPFTKGLRNCIGMLFGDVFSFGN